MHFGNRRSNAEQHAGKRRRGFREILKTHRASRNQVGKAGESPRSTRMACRKPFHEGPALHRLQQFVESESCPRARWWSTSHARCKSHKFREETALPQREPLPRSAQLLAAVLILSLPLHAGHAHKRHVSPTPTDPGYTAALSAANRFLHAWQSGDVETGMVLLSDGVRHSENPDKVEQFFAGT